MASKRTPDEMMAQMLNGMPNIEELTEIKAEQSEAEDQPKQPEPRKEEAPKTRKPSKATTPDITTTFQTTEEKWNKIRAISQQRDVSIRSIINCALDMFIETYQSKYGKVNYKKFKKKGDASELFQ